MAGRERDMDKKNILVVDDDETICKLLKLNLEENKEYEVWIATSGEKALEIIKTNRPDLVLLDINMPGMSGMELLERIMVVEPEMPVAMVTAVWDADEAKRAREAGAYDYIVKPVDLEYLRTAILVKLFC